MGERLEKETNPQISLVELYCIFLLVMEAIASRGTVKGH